MVHVPEVSLEEDKFEKEKTSDSDRNSENDRSSEKDNSNYSIVVGNVHKDEHDILVLQLVILIMFLFLSGLIYYNP